VVEQAAIGIVLLSLVAGSVKTWLFKWTAADDDEIHVSPLVGRELLAGESIGAFEVLRNRERTAQGLS
jgi:hypothetical protein